MSRLDEARKAHERALRTLAEQICALIDALEPLATKLRLEHYGIAHIESHRIDRNAFVSLLGELGLFELDDGEALASAIEEREVEHG